MNPSSPSVEALLPDILGKDFCLPPMPTVIGEIFSLMQQPIDSIETSQIIKLVENDPALVSHLLRLANSPFYGSLRDITHLSQAVTRIGLEEVLSSLHFYLIRQMMPMDTASVAFSPEQFWLHSWAVATIACRLGQPRFLVSRYPGQLHIAGLLHDIGKAILAVNASERLATCIEEANQNQVPLCVAEREILGIDHGVLGAHLLDEWLLPRPVLDAVGYHHTPDEAIRENRDLAGLIQLADSIAWQCGFNDGCLVTMPEAGPLWIEGQQRMPLSNSDVREIFQKEVHDELNARLAKAENENQEKKASRKVTARPPRDRHPVKTPYADPDPRPKGFWARLGLTLAHLFGNN